MGVITAAVLKLAPRPVATEVALCALPSPEAATELFRRFQLHDAAALQAFEDVAGIGMGFVLAHIPGATLPLSSPAPHYVLVELATTRQDANMREGLETVLEAALEADLVQDAPSSPRARRSVRRSGGCARSLPKHRSGRARASRTTFRCRSPACRN